jgi:hypothetical protein
MRYNPDTERFINIDEIAAQCRAAIMKPAQPAQVSYDDILHFYRWENDTLIPEVCEVW